MFAKDHSEKLQIESNATARVDRLGLSTSGFRVALLLNGQPGVDTKLRKPRMPHFKTLHLNIRSHHQAAPSIWFASQAHHILLGIQSPPSNPSTPLDPSSLLKPYTTRKHPQPPFALPPRSVESGPLGGEIRVRPVQGRWIQGFREQLPDSHAAQDLEFKVGGCGSYYKTGPFQQINRLGNINFCQVPYRVWGLEI